MSLPDVTPDEILNAIQQVPVERWGEALRAIENLQVEQTPATLLDAPVRSGKELSDSCLIGIWADRDDIRNNHEFARELRRQAENRE